MRPIPRRVLFILAIAACVAGLRGRTASARAEDDPVAPIAPKVWKSSDGKCSVTLPGSWTGHPGKIEEFDLLFLSGETADHAQFTFLARDRSSSEIATTRALLRFDSEWHESQPGNSALTVTEGQFSYATWEDDSTPASPTTAFSTMICANRRMCSATLRIGRGAAAAQKAAILDALRSFTTSLPDPSPPPAKYVRTEKSGVECFAAPEVSSAEAGKALSIVTAAFAAFAKRHGAARPGGGSSPRIFLHANRGACTASAEANGGPSADQETGYGLTTATSTLHLWPVDEKDLRMRGHVTQLATRLAYSCTFGSTRPSWLWNATAFLAWGEALTGKSLPALPLSLKQLMRPGALVTFEDLRTYPDEKVVADRLGDGIAYLALLRDGPARYQTAYREFLASWNKDGDFDAAMKRLLALDQAKMRDDAESYRTALKWATSK